MRDPVAVRDSDPSQSSRRAIRREQIQRDALTTELNAARARTLALTWEKADLLQRQFTMAQQFDRRLAASLQMIATLLSMQSRAVSTLEATLQLNAAADHVVAFAQAHHRLDVIDERTVDEDGVCRDDDFAHVIEQRSAARDARSRDVPISGGRWPRPAVAGARQPQEGSS